MLWGKKAPAGAKEEEAGGASSSSEKNKEKYVKQVWYGSPLDRRAILVEEANRRMAAEKVTFVSELKAYFSPRRRLRLDPQKHLYFIINEPNKHVASAVSIKNVSKSHVAFKFQTTVPHSCFMRPNGGVIAPNEQIIATVTKFYEERLESEKERKTKEIKEKFKIISVPVQPDVDYYPDMFEDDEDNVSMERILEVVFIASNKASSEQKNKLQRLLAEADAAEEARKNAIKEAEEEVEEENIVAPIPEGQGQVINEWKQRREAFLAQQQAGGQTPS